MHQDLWDDATDVVSEDSWRVQGSHFISNSPSWGVGQSCTGAVKKPFLKELRTCCLCSMTWIWAWWHCIRRPAEVLGHHRDT